MAIINENESKLQGTASLTEFNIEMNSVVFGMMTKDVYTDLVLAPMREYSTNAIDACLAADLPVRYDVTLPTILNSQFGVRDYGTGLPPEDIEGYDEEYTYIDEDTGNIIKDTRKVPGLFSVLGASTKRNSNLYNGQFGIGRMSALAYTSSFNVESYYNGTKYSYLISTDSGIPQTVSLGSSPTTEANGLHIYFPVQVKDQSQFTKKAADLYRFFDHKPNLNQPIYYPELKVDIEGSDWRIEDTNYSDRYHGKMLVIMGNVAYEVSPSTFQGSDIRDLAFTSIRLDVPLGSVSITPGRESLSMDEKTIKYLTDRLKKVASEVAAEFLNNVASLPTTWERMVKYNTSVNSLPYAIRKATKPVVSKHEEQYFSIRGNNYIQLRDLHATTTDIVFQHWAHHRVTGKKLGSHNVNVNANMYFIISDIRAGAREAVEAYRAKLQSRRAEIIVLKPAKWDKDNIPANVKLMKTYLKQMGDVPYVLASDYYTPVPKIKGVSSVRTATDFNPVVFDLRNSNVYPRRGNKLSKYTSDKFYYVETSGLSLTGMTSDRLAIYLRFVALYRSQNSKKAENFSIVGVPKNGMANIKNDPRFIPLEGSLQHLVKHVHIVDTSELYKFTNTSNMSPSNLLDVKLPKQVQAYLQALSDFKDKYSTHNSNLSTEGVTTIFKCSNDKPKTTYTIDQMYKDYPLLSTILRGRYYWKNHMISRYLLLEEQNKGLPNGI